MKSLSSMNPTQQMAEEMGARRQNQPPLTSGKFYAQVEAGRRSDLEHSKGQSNNGRAGAASGSPGKKPRQAQPKAA
jgi:hypothetical protein